MGNIQIIDVKATAESNKKYWKIMLDEFRNEGYIINRFGEIYGNKNTLNKFAILLCKMWSVLPLFVPKTSVKQWKEEDFILVLRNASELEEYNSLLQKSKLNWDVYF